MATYKLTYFDFASSRGEECRLALFLSGIPFEDERVKLPDWPGIKDGTPFGALPVLTVEGHKPVAQSNAILRLVGSMNGLHPKDEWEAARHEALLGVVEDLRNKIGPVLRIKEEEEKKRAREELAKGYLQEWGAAVEKQLGEGPFVGGDKINVADLKLFVALNTFVKGGIDHISPEVFSKFPRLMKVHHSVKAHPKVVEWYARAA